LDKLPSSIEAYLTESGFSPTEKLILKRFLEGEALTVRELAAKTGKGTSILDRAVRKLMRKEIVKKETVNGTKKFAVESLSSIQRWIKKDADKKKEDLKRREHDFEVFLATLHRELCRPELEHFDGEDSLFDAYNAVINLAKTDRQILRYISSGGSDSKYLIDEFHKGFNRARIKEGISEHVLACNNLESRKLKSRDGYERRETSLLSDEKCPITFEKIITRDSVAYFNSKEMKATIIHYPELAEEERRAFDTLKGNALKEDQLHLEKKSGIDQFKMNLISFFKQGYPIRLRVSFLAYFAILAVILGMK